MNTPETNQYNLRLINIVNDFNENLKTLLKREGILDYSLDDIYTEARNFGSARNIVASLPNGVGAELIRNMTQQHIIGYINASTNVPKEEVCVNPGKYSTEEDKLKYHLCRLDSIIYHLMELQRDVSKTEVDIGKDLRDLIRLAKVTRADFYNSIYD